MPRDLTGRSRVTADEQSIEYEAEGSYIYTVPIISGRKEAWDQKASSPSAPPEPVEGAEESQQGNG